MSRVFVVSDTWFNRPMSNLQDEMVVDYNNKIIEKWNLTVSSDDTIYVLGGFGVGDLYHIIVRLKGNIHFLNNNYTSDDQFVFDVLKNSILCSVDKKLHNRVSFEESQIIVLKDEDVILSYFPLVDWCGKNTGTWCYHGLIDCNSFNEHRITCKSSVWGMTPVDVKKVQNDISKFSNNSI